MSEIKKITNKIKKFRDEIKVSVPFVKYEKLDEKVRVFADKCFKEIFDGNN